MSNFTIHVLPINKIHCKWNCSNRANSESHLQDNRWVVPAYTLQIILNFTASNYSSKLDKDLNQYLILKRGFQNFVTLQYKHGCWPAVFVGTSCHSTGEPGKNIWHKVAIVFSAISMYGSKARLWCIPWESCLQSLWIKYHSNLSDNKLVQLLHGSNNGAAEGFFLSIIQIQLGRRGEGGQEE